MVSSRAHSVAPLLVAFAWLPQSGAWGQVTLPDEEPPPAEHQDVKKSVDWLYAPAPFSSPSTGTGLAAGVAAFYNPNGGPNQWVTGAGVVWTSNGSRGIAVAHRMSSADDRFRFDAFASLLNRESNFYGIGQDAGDAGDTLVLDDKGVRLRSRALLKASEGVYIGARYDLATHDAKPDESEGPSLVEVPPADQRDSTLSMLGPVLSFDTRDNHDKPSRGLLINVTWLVGAEIIGNSFSHNKLTLNASTYYRVAEKTVLAGRAAMCSVAGDVPYYNLCLFGSTADLRGYPAGRYRDSASWALQGELRRQLNTRWGATAFVGLGGIAPSVGEIFGDGNLLPAAGVGVRYRPFKGNDVQLRADFAIGSDSTGFYLGLGEAF